MLGGVFRLKKKLLVGVCGIKLVFGSMVMVVMSELFNNDIIYIICLMWVLVSVMMKLVSLC